MQIAFWILSAITILGAICAITMRNLFHCLFSLIVSLLGIAGFYILLFADFFAMIQAFVYTGAIAVLMIFAIMLTRHVMGDEGPREVLGGKWWAGMGAASIIAGLLWAIIRKDQLTQVFPAEGAGLSYAKMVETIGRALVMDWVVPFEAMAVLLTAALIGAVVIALEEVIRKR